MLLDTRNVVDDMIGRFRRPPLSGLDKVRGERSLFVSAHPISGNTWTSFVLTYCLNVPFWDVDRDAMSSFNEGFRQYLTGTNTHRRTAHFDCVLKTHASPSRIELHRGDRVVVVMRDIRDVTNSYYHRLLRRWPESPDWKRRLFIRAASSVSAPTRHSIAIRYFARRWADFASDVLKANAIVIRYEDMLEAPGDAIGSVLTQIAPDVMESTRLAEAVDLFSLSSMRREAAKASQNHPVRSGTAGDWRNHFSPRDAAWITSRFGGLMREFGYDPR